MKCKVTFIDHRGVYTTKVVENVDRVHETNNSIFLMCGSKAIFVMSLKNFVFLEQAD